MYSKARLKNSINGIDEDIGVFEYSFFVQAVCLSAGGWLWWLLKGFVGIGEMGLGRLIICWSSAEVDLVVVRAEIVVWRGVDSNGGIQVATGSIGGAGTGTLWNLSMFMECIFLPCLMR